MVKKEGEETGGGKENGKTKLIQKEGKYQREGERKGKGKVTCQYCAVCTAYIGTASGELFYFILPVIS